jgi:hypothetical protein
MTCGSFWYYQMDHANCAMPIITSLWATWEVLRTAIKDAASRPYQRPATVVKPDPMAQLAEKRCGMCSIMPEFGQQIALTPVLEAPQMTNNIQDLLAAQGDKFPQLVWPGGYPMFYLCQDGGVLCSKCANDNRSQIDMAEENHNKQWNVIEYDINWEDQELLCDHCEQRIESAYA